jgi:hypothetical protein
MLMVHVVFTFGSAHGAGRHAGLKLLISHFPFHIGGAAQHLTGGIANIGAVQVAANTTREAVHIVFAQTSIGAYGASLHTFEAGAYTVGQQFGIDMPLRRVGFKHVIDDSHINLAS